MSSAPSPTTGPITLEQLQSRPVFAIRLANSGPLVPTASPTTESGDPFQLRHLTRVGADAVLPLLCSGLGRVQTTKYLNHGVQSLVSEKFRFFPELLLPFPHPLPHVPGWKMRAERGRVIFAGKHIVSSFAGTCAMMGLHPRMQWRGKPDVVLEKGILTGMFLDIDASPAEELPGDLAGQGFRMNDEENGEVTFKLPICVDLQKATEESSATRRERRAGAERSFFPAASPASIMSALRYAREQRKTVSVGMTSVHWNGSYSNVVKVGRHSDLATIRSCPEYPAADELGMLIEKREFVSIAGVVAAFALEEEPTS